MYNVFNKMNVSYQLSDYSEAELQLYNETITVYDLIIGNGDYVKGLYYYLYLSGKQYDYNDILKEFIINLYSNLIKNIDNNMKMIEMLFMKGANPNYEFTYKNNINDYTNYTTIFFKLIDIYNIELNNPIVQLFIKYGGNFFHEIKNKDNKEKEEYYIYENAIQIAIDDGKYDFIKYLIKNGLNINYRIDNKTIFQYYIIHIILQGSILDEEYYEDKCIDLVKLLIQYNHSTENLEEEIGELVNVDGYSIINILMKNNVSLNKCNNDRVHYRLSLCYKLTDKILSSDNNIECKFIYKFMKKCIRYGMIIPIKKYNNEFKNNYLLNKVHKYYLLYTIFDKIRIQNKCNRYIDLMKKHHHLMFDIAYLPKGYINSNFPGGEEYLKAEESFYSQIINSYIIQFI